MEEDKEKDKFPEAEALFGDYITPENESEYSSIERDDSAVNRNFGLNANLQI